LMLITKHDLSTKKENKKLESDTPVWTN
jgi:hypothetical protein